jgi:hypothetical protein
MKRRTVQDLITTYRRAKARRYSDEVPEAAAELGAALAKTGILTEPSADGKFTTVWQPVAVEGGPPGFAMKRFRNTTIAAPRYAPAQQLQPA